MPEENVAGSCPARPPRIAARAQCVTECACAKCLAMETGNKMEDYVVNVLHKREEHAREASIKSTLLKRPRIEEYAADRLMESCEGSRVNGQLEGECRAVFKDGRCYEGDFKEGLMHGMGKFTWTDGLIYEGEMRWSQITGGGRYTWPDGSSYTGDVVNGFRHGNGTYHSPTTSSTYTGHWVDGRREGEGRLSFLTASGGTMEVGGEMGEDGDGDRPAASSGDGGSYYEGQWKNNKQHGTGIRRYRAGNVYSGEWREGVKEGEGEMVWDGGKQRYKGHWAHGSPNGYGVCIWLAPPSLNHAQHPVSNRYEGEWKNGLRHGQGTFYYASGAVYRGEWSEGLKEGRGTFTFTNGDTFTGSFHRDSMCNSSTGGDDEGGGGEVVGLRPQTPLGSLIGDVGPSDRGVTQQFNMSISHLLLPSSDTESQTQLNQVHAVILQNISQLKKIYHFYSSLGANPLQPSHSLSRLQFWQLLKDCRIHHQGLSVWEADTIAAPPPPCPSSPLLMREFLQSLVLLAHHLYHNTIAGVSDCLSQLLRHLILPHACSLTGRVFTSPSLPPSTLHLDQTWKLYQSLAQTTADGVPYVTMRALLLRFKDGGIVPQLMGADVVVRSLVQNQPLALDKNDYNLEIKMTVLDVIETVLQCCHVTSCDQSHDRTNVITPNQVFSLLTGQ